MSWPTFLPKESWRKEATKVAEPCGTQTCPAHGDQESRTSSSSRYARWQKHCGNRVSDSDTRIDSFLFVASCSYCWGIGCRHKTGVVHEYIRCPFPLLRGSADASGCVSWSGCRLALDPFCQKWS